MEKTDVALAQLLPLIQQELAQGKCVTFSPMGTSMEPMLRQGVDTVTLSPLPPVLKKYDLPLYRRANGQFVLHRIVKEGQTYTCMGDNQFLPEPGIAPCQMIGLVTAFTRGGRAWAVTDPRYRLYCRLWQGSRPLRHLWRRILGKLRRALS